MKHCAAKACLFYYLAILANIALICIILFFSSQAYGRDAQMALFFLIPPVLSLAVFRKGGDKEERDLKNRIRKAQLRKDLKELSDFDKSE